MLTIRITVMLLFINACQFGIAADEGIVVEMQTGQKIRANSISTDTIRPEKVVLEVTNERISLKRVMNWSRVKTVFAPADTALDLKVPSGVAVKDIAELSKPTVESAAPPEPGQYESSTPIRDPRTFQFVPPAPAAMLPFDSAVAPGQVPMIGPPLESGYLSSLRCGPCEVICPTPGLLLWRDPGVVVGVRNQDGTPLSFSGNSTIVPAAQIDDLEPRELVVSARAFNRNGLADWNSLEVLVQGRTASGAPCPLRGSLRLSLLSRRARLVRAYAETYFEEPSDLVLLSSWSQFIDASDVGRTGVQKVVVPLPVRSADHNFGTAQYGVLAAEIDIPGQGRLATTSQPIALRQVDTVRNRSVVDYGDTMLPGQSVSEGRNDPGYWPAPLSNLRPDSRRFTVQP